MTDLTYENPYWQDEQSVAPFVGRGMVFSHLHQHLIEPAGPQAAFIIGRQRIGKTALLLHFDTLFDESFVGLYIPLRETALDSETAWLETLVRAASMMLEQRGFTLRRLMDRTKEDYDLRDWVLNTRLQDIFATIRPQRRLIFLIDDADQLLDAIADQRLPEDSFVYLQSMLKEHPQLRMIFTLDARHENRLDSFKPLIDPTARMWLHTLEPEESTQLLRLPVHGMYTVSDDAAAVAQQLTGRHPYLLQIVGFYLFDHWQRHPDQTTMDVDTVKALTPQIYTTGEPFYAEQWKELTQDERLVLTAISSRLYDNPLQKMDTSTIQSWLVKTDYPIDSTAINAAVRSLEYREIIRSGAEGIHISAGLLQKWLLENARLDPAPFTAASGSTRRRIVWLVAVLLILISLALAAFALNLPRTEAPGLPEPTVTLHSG